MLWELEILVSIIYFNISKWKSAHALSFISRFRPSLLCQAGWDDGLNTNLLSTFKHSIPISQIYFLWKSSWFLMSLRERVGSLRWTAIVFHHDHHGYFNLIGAGDQRLNSHSENNLKFNMPSRKEGNTLQQSPFLLTIFSCPASNNI